MKKIITTNLENEFRNMNSQGRKYGQGGFTKTSMLEKNDLPKNIQRKM